MEYEKEELTCLESVEQLFENPDASFELQHKREYVRVCLETFASDDQVRRPVHLKSSANTRK